MINRLKDLLFQNRSLRQTIVKNTFWLSVGQIGSRLFRALVIIYAARILGAAEYGVFSYALGLAGFFTIFADIGLSPILTREITQKPEEKNYYFSTAFWLKILVLVLTAFLIIFAAPHFSKIKEAKSLMPIIALIVIFDGLRDFSLAVFRAKEKMEFEALVTTSTNFAIMTFGFVALYFSVTSKALTLSYAFSVISGFFVGFLLLKEQFLKIFSHFRWSLIKPLLSSAYPIAILGLLGVFMLNTDIIMLGWWRTPQEIGFYSAGQKIIQLLYTLPAILATSLFPVFSRLAGKKENEKVKFLMEKAMAFAFFISIPIFVGGNVLASSLIKFLYGNEYLGGVSSFRILIFTPLLIFAQIFLSNFILAYNQQRRLKLPVVLGSIGNIVFNALLIPTYGIVGSSVATVIAQSLNVGLTWKIAKKINLFYTLPHLIKIAVGAIVMGIFGYILNRLEINVIINIILSAGIYFGVLYLLKEKILEEIKIILKAAKK